MRYARLLLCLIIAICQLQIPISNTDALGSPDIVIAQVYSGATGIATQELIELYNNGSQAVNVTGWCVNYVSSSGATTTKLGCLSAPDTSTALWLKAGGYATFASSEYQMAQQVNADVSFAGGMSSTAGHVRLLNAASVEVDRLGWGTAVNPEMTATPQPANAKSLERKIAIPTGLQDTDNNFDDFVQATPIFHSSDVYEVVTIIDVCSNISGVQSTMPTGYQADENGLCQPDSCLNLVGLQVSVPDNYDSDAAGNCTQHDECNNLDGIQTVIPASMVRVSVNDCEWDIIPLLLTEILPNAIGSDTGNEFVEVYNPTDRTADLSLYSVRTGVNSDKTYVFPADTTIAPGEYRAFSDAALKFTLVNTSGRVVLSAVNGVNLSDSGVYDSPGDGESWALVGGVWQYTNQPTPGAANMASLETDEVVAQSTNNGPAPCAAGKYRNPLTNRCRNIESDASVLASCDADQYRSPETGRCRKITLAGAAAPCKDGQYRSEETNRCRNLPATNVPNAAFAVQPVKDTGLAFVGWWALGGVGLLAVGYAAWEWRREVAGLWQRAIGRFSAK